MLSLYTLYEAPKKVIGRSETKNYRIEDYKNPPEKHIQGYRTKTVRSNGDDRKTLIKLALVKNPETGEVKTQKTSIWREKQ